MIDREKLKRAVEALRNGGKCYVGARAMELLHRSAHEEGIGEHFDRACRDGVYNLCQYLEPWDLVVLARDDESFIWKPNFHG